jgi:Uncharacterized protein conserved in bacteria (DUF2252)
MSTTDASIQEATACYETWLGEQIALVAADLARKHEQMVLDAFAFFRATYYRWAQLWPRLCPELATAPAVLAAGDLHIENFGTWRDGDGRLVWGINDFDEAYRLPYTNDLLRLATSALLAIRNEHLTLPPKAACKALLAGYQAGLKSGGRPFVLAEGHAWLVRVATKRERNAAAFWTRLSRSAAASDRDGPSDDARAALQSALPDNTAGYELRSRVAGEGSLGHQRWVATMEWRGGRLAREAKARAPSASIWCLGDSRQAPAGDPYADIVGRAVRSPDPSLRIDEHWLVRRLAHDCSRVELSSLPGPKLEAALLEAMGRETANVHLGSADEASALADLQQRADSWLLNGSRIMLKAVVRDWKAYRRSG